MSASSSCPDPHVLDLPNADRSILHLEHLNFNQNNEAQTKLFYSQLLGCTLDPYSTARSSATLWFNLGQSQFHLPSTPEPNRLHGHIGICVTSTHYNTLKDRYDIIKDKSIMQNTPLNMKLISAPYTDVQIQFVLKSHPIAEHPTIHKSWESITEDAHRPDADEREFTYCQITGPNGNVFDIFCLLEQQSTAEQKQQPQQLSLPEEEQKNPAIHIMPDGGPANGPGIAYALINVDPNALDAVQYYYDYYFNTPIKTHHTTDNTTIVEVNVGLTQRLFFSASSHHDHVEYDPTWHYCIYIAPYSTIFERLLSDELIAVFEDRSDYVLSMEVAIDTKQYRGYKIIDRDHNVRLMIEQEIRAAQHKHYGRRLANQIQPMPQPD